MKKEKTWIIRGSVRRFRRDFLEGLGPKISLVIEVDSFQSGYAKAYRYEVAKPWIELSSLKNSREQLSSQEFYLGENLVVWVTESTDEKGKKSFSLKRMDEKTMDIISVSDFLKNCI